MEVVSNNFMPGDPRLVQQLVYELKSQGIFDQFRKECIADVDTKPAYQNLRQRVEGSVTSFLKQQTWRPDMNKNQVREQLRKSIYESGYLETGVERIVDQVVNPKINTVFLPQVEDVVYRYLGIEKPNRLEIKKELKIDVTDLLPTDLEAVSPESDHTKDDNLNLNDSLNVDSKLEEDESPPFEPLDEQHNDVQHEENSVDSHLSGFSGLQSHDSNPGNEAKMSQMELSNQDSQVSHNSSESHLSIITSEDNTKMEICEESESKLEAKIENSFEIHMISAKNTVQNDSQEIKDIEKIEPEKKDEKIFDEKKFEEKKIMEKRNDDKKLDEKKYEDKKSIERKNDDKKSRSSEKYSSKDKKDDKYRKSSSNNSGRDKDKTNSRHSSSSSSRDKDKSKDKKDSKTNSSNSKDKVKVEKDKEKSEKERSDKEKPKSDKEKERSDKDKSKSSNSSKHSNSKDKDKNHSSSKKESSSKDKEKSRSSSSSTSKENKSKSYSESKSKSSTDKHQKDDKSSHNGKHSNNSSSLKKDKDKKRDVKKESKDDHYSSKDKKNDRRSTDRDSNDGQSSRQSQSNSFTESSSSHTQKNSQDSSNSNSGSGSGDSGNSDQTEHTKVISPIKLSSPMATTCADVQKFKYIKPKFASNFEEARKLMKIRKQLAKLERQNQLSLTQIEVSVEIPNGIAYPEENLIKEIDKEEVDKGAECNQEPKTPEKKQTISAPKEEVTPVLQSTELSKENWEALEARLAQEMSNINYNSYESPYDYDYDYGGYNSVVISPRKNTIVTNNSIVKEESNKTERSKSCKLDFVKEEDDVSQKGIDILVESSKPPNQEDIIKSDLKNNVEKRRKLRVELEATIYKSTKGVVKIIERKQKITKNGNKIEPDLIEVQKLVENNPPGNERETISNLKTDVDITHKSDEKLDVSDDDYECRYLEIPSRSMEHNLQFIRSYIKKLEEDVEQSIKTYQNNFLSANRLGCKRKLEENVDLKNNNKAHYEQTTEPKKRRSIAPNRNSVISKANKEKMCNSTDISPNDSFSLPLSPAESDKSNDKKEDESPKLAKQKRNVIARNTSTRNQRYSSEDLYKPRPIIIASTRRSRSAKNQGN